MSKRQRSIPRIIDEDFDRLGQFISHVQIHEPSLNPYQRVWLGVIFQELEDLTIKQMSSLRREEAFKWFFGKENRKDFETVCENAQIDPNAMRERAKQIMQSGLQQRAPKGTAKTYQKRRARYLKNKFSGMAAPAIQSGFGGDSIL